MRKSFGTTQLDLIRSNANLPTLNGGFRITDHLGALTPDGGSASKGAATYYCPNCGAKNFKVELDTAAYNTFSCDCAHTDAGKALIREKLSPARAPNQWSKPVRPKAFRTWKYYDADGNLTITTCRKDDGEGHRDFWQEYPAGYPKEDEVGRARLRSWTMPYRYQEALAAVEEGDTLFWVEGEAKADTLWSLGIPATTSIGGSSGYKKYGDYAGLFPASQLVICPDRDKVGIKYGDAIAQDYPAARWAYAQPVSSTWSRLPNDGGFDIGNWIESGATREEVLASIEPTRRPDFGTLSEDMRTPAIFAIVKYVLGGGRVKIDGQLATTTQFVLAVTRFWRPRAEDEDVDSVGVALLRLAHSLGDSKVSIVLSNLKSLLKGIGVGATVVTAWQKVALKQIAAEQQVRHAAEMKASPLFDYARVVPGAQSDILQTLNALVEAGADRLKLNLLTDEITRDGELVEMNKVKMFVAQLTDRDASESDSAQCVIALAQKNQFHPVHDWLEEVYQAYGDTTRNEIATVATDYMGVEGDEEQVALYNLYMRNFLIAAVARIYKPGCKLDEVYVLQGGQGSRKSTFFEAIAGTEWFDNNLGTDTQNKDELAKIHRCWIQEWAELDRVTSKKEASHLKSFITTCTDRYRPPYAREQVDFPRRSIIVATVNKTDFLVDEENRRFCVIPIPSKQAINIDAIIANRSRLWAGAVAAYKAGELWHLEEEVQVIQERQNKAYKEEHVWQEAIARWLEIPGNTIAREAPNGAPAYWVSVGMILSQCLSIELARHDNKGKRAVTAILKDLGWIQPTNATRLPNQGLVRAWYKLV